MSKKRPENLNKDGLPTRTGVYLVKGAFGDKKEKREIDVYEHETKGLCCFIYDYGAEEGAGVNDDTDCHVSVQFTGLKFIKRVRDLGKEENKK